MLKPGLNAKCCLAVVCGLLIVGVSLGQSGFHPDSLKQILRSARDEDARMAALKELAEGYLMTDPDEALIYSGRLLEKGRQSGDRAVMADGYRLKGRIYLLRNSYDTAVSYCDSGISVAMEAGDISGRAALNIIKGNALFYSQGPEHGIGPYKESCRLYDSAGDSAGMSKALNGLGVMYKKMSQYDSALSCFVQLVTISEEKGYEENLGMGYLNIGILYQDLLELEKASDYLALSIPINEKFRPDLVALAHMNIGLIHYEKKAWDTALVELNVALDIYRSMDDHQCMADVYNNMGNVYIDSRNLDSADHYYTRAKIIYQQLKSWYPYAQVLNNLALVNIYRGNYGPAVPILDSCIAIAVRTKNLELEKQAHYNTYLAYKNMQSSQKALESYLIYDSLQQIIYNLDKEEMMADLEMKYQNEKKQSQILALEKSFLQKDLDLQIKTKQSNIYLFTGIGITALLVFAFLYFRQRAVKDRIIARQRIRQLEEEKKLLAAKSLVEGQEEERKRIARELHDGLGVLLSTTKMQFSSIRDKSPDNQVIIDRAIRLLEQASSDVRRISHNMMPGLLTKLGFFEAAADLFEKVSETEGLNVRADIPEIAERLPGNKEIMLYRIIQELVNNTLKHSGAKNIEIQIQMLPGHLDIIYSDDGKGFDMEQKLESRSIGLSSIQSRVNFMNGKMHLHSEPGKGVSYQFEIPD